MGKGSGGCDDRTPMLVGEEDNAVEAVDLNSAYQSDGVLSRACYGKMYTIISQGGWAHGGHYRASEQYIATQLRRHAKGIHDNTPTERQLSQVDDPTLFILLDEMILEDKQQLSKHLGVRADALRNWAEQKQAEADDAAAEAAAIQAQYEYAKSIGQ